MKKALFAFSIALLTVHASFAQSTDGDKPATPAQTNFYAELGGPGVLFSANIDRRFKKSRLGWGGRVGLGFVTGDEPYNPNDPNNYYYRQRSVLTIPVQVNYIFGKENSPHTFEVGAGLTVLGRRTDIFSYNYYDSGSAVLGSAAFMYRRQPLDGGFTWRIGFTPLMTDGYIQASGGVSVGYAF
jgi:hypothetical protein